MKKILIIDDEIHIVELLKFNLENNGYKVDYSYDGFDGYLKTKEFQPDLILLDWMLPNISGIDLLKKIRSDETLEQIPVIMLTAKNMEEDKLEGLEDGADDYITKPFNILEVKARIKAIMRRTSGNKEKKVNSSEINKGDLRLDMDSRRLFILGREVNLTAKEFDLLELLVKNENKVYSREDLLGLVWGKDYPGDVRTVDVHVRRLREKIEANPSEPKYVHTKWGVGYYYNQK